MPKVIKYLTLDLLKQEADKRNLEIFETPASYSFSIFVNRKRTELHIIYK